MLKNYISVSRLKFFVGAAVVAFSLSMQSCEQVEDAVQPEELVAKSDSGSPIAGKYIVVLKQGSGLRLAATASYPEKLRQVKSFGQQVLRERGINPETIEQSYGQVLQGFSAELTDAEVAKLRRDSRVDYIEQDKVISLGKPSGGGSTPAAEETPVGITRVGLADGTGKTAWVIDSGIDLDHPDLNVDVARSRTFITTGKDANSADDGNGHGSHVAGTIAAKKGNNIGVVGVAYNATVVAVKVLNSQGSGSTSGVIAGIDYVAANGKPGDVANMSLGGGVSVSIDNAVINAAAKGVIFCLAAGNESDDADNHSPARAEGANIYTISAMNSADSWASFSNYGAHVDYCAPGVNIKSTWKGGGYNTISGTSMATPHAAGVMLITGGKPTISGYVKNDPDGKADPIIHL